MVCHYYVWYWFFDHRFKYEDFVCNDCHDLLIYVNISNIAIITIKRADYRCIIYGIRKSNAIKLLENNVLDDRGYI